MARRRSKRFSFLGALALAVLLAVPGPAPVAREADDRMNYVMPGISAEQAAAMVRRSYGGRVLSVKAVGRGESRGYQVRVLLEGGRVKTVFVGADGRVRG